MSPLRRAAIGTIKVVHSAIFLVNAAAVLHIFWFGLLDRRSRWTCVALGAAPGQMTVGDSTTVMLYKLCRAALAARPDRSELVLDSYHFPHDRLVLEGIATE